MPLFKLSVIEKPTAKKSKDMSTEGCSESDEESIMQLVNEASPNDSEHESDEVKDALGQELPGTETAENMPNNSTGSGRQSPVADSPICTLLAADSVTSEEANPLSEPVASDIPFIENSVQSTFLELPVDASASKLSSDTGDNQDLDTSPDGATAQRSHPEDAGTGGGKERVSLGDTIMVDRVQANIQQLLQLIGKISKAAD